MGQSVVNGTCALAVRGLSFMTSANVTELIKITRCHTHKIYQNYWLLFVPTPLPLSADVINGGPLTWLRTSSDGIP